MGSKGISVQKFYYSSGAEVNEALAAGKIDAIMSGNCVLDEDKSWLLNLIICCVYHYGKKQYGINGAAGSGDAGDNAGKSLFYCRVVREFYGRADKFAKGFTRAELAYIQTAAPLRVVGDADNYPMEWLDGKNGVYKGTLSGCAEIIGSEQRFNDGNDLHS